MRLAPGCVGFALWLGLSGMAVAQDALPAAALRLDYDLPIDALQRVQRTSLEVDLEAQLARAVRVVAKRLGPEFGVERRAATGFTVVLPAARAAEVEHARRLVESAGTMEFRILASPAKGPNDFEFDLDGERGRLQAWLHSGGKEKVLVDSGALDEFHVDGKRGPLAGDKLRWAVHRIRPRVDDPARWQARLGEHMPAVAAATVPLFTEEEWNDGNVPPARRAGGAPPTLTELVALDCHQRSFTQELFDPDAVAVEAARHGPGVQVSYGLLPAHATPFADWTERNAGRGCAVVWNGEVTTIAILLTRISGRGVITGLGAQESKDELATILRSGALPAAPRLVRIDTVRGR